MKETQRNFWSEHKDLRVAERTQLPQSRRGMKAPFVTTQERRGCASEIAVNTPKSPTWLFQTTQSIFTVPHLSGRSPNPITAPFLP
ncbi:hypothetical protein CEXT_785611 [Caerostris extrusa]|uniref:Uncharacterized protein n=1 Tax=Caerostris extrusa TaxID=172846 RepID=A0AAV4MIC8_CAEEX|nr:hypothetical protein CEXT_785611 [Caerostris extrusa]